MWDRIILICLGVWALLFGLVHVTNLKIEAMTTVMGFAALVLGLVCCIRAVATFVVVQPPKP